MKAIYAQYIGDATSEETPRNWGMGAAPRTSFSYLSPECDAAPTGASGQNAVNLSVYRRSVDVFERSWKWEMVRKEDPNP